MKRPFLLPALVLTLVSTLAGAQTIHLEAENGSLSGPDMKVVRPEANDAAAAQDFSGTGYVQGFNTDADFVTITFKSKVARLCDLSMAYRADGRKGFDVVVNGLGLTGMLTPTSGSSFHVQKLGKVDIVQGQNTIVVRKGWGYFDLDYLELAPTGPVLLPTRPTAMPSDHGITPEARALLAQLDANYGVNTAVGVYDDKDAAYALEVTGVRPAIMGGDLMRYSPQFQAHGSSTDNEVERLIADHNAGMTITLSWHWASPVGILDTKEKPWWRGFYADSTSFDLQKTLANPSGPEYVAMIGDIHQIAIQLRRFQDAKVPLLWRPLHEAQDQTFWWGAKGPAAFKTLWRLLYYQLTEVEGIHNLIWVFTSEGDPAWYPGDAYVDVVGIDAYPQDIHDPQSAMWDELQHQFAGRRPLAITEFGGVPDIPRMQRQGEFWSYAVSWSEDNGPRKNKPEELRQIYKSPGTATLPPTGGGWPGIPLQPEAAPAPAHPAAPANF